MDRSIRLTLPNPCAEDWDKMMPDSRGRFCASCEKAVMDFSGMSNEDFIAFFQTAKDMPLCGRYTGAQLSLSIPVTDARHRELKLQEAPERIKFKAIRPIPVTPYISRTDTQYRRKLRPAMLYPNVVSGRVTDKGGRAVPGTVIRVKHTGAATVADNTGHFSIMLAYNHTTLTCMEKDIVVKEVRVYDISRPLCIILPGLP